MGESAHDCLSDVERLLIFLRAFEAWIERVEGRKIFCRGTLHAGERLCAEAEAIFVSLKPGIFAGLVEKRLEREAG